MPRASGDRGSGGRKANRPSIRQLQPSQPSLSPSTPTTDTRANGHQRSWGYHFNAAEQHGDVEPGVTANDVWTWWPEHNGSSSAQYNYTATGQGAEQDAYNTVPLYQYNTQASHSNGNTGNVFPWDGDSTLNRFDNMDLQDDDDQCGVAVDTNHRHPVTEFPDTEENDDSGIAFEENSAPQYSEGSSTVMYSDGQSALQSTEGNSAVQSSEGNSGEGNVVRRHCDVPDCGRVVKLKSFKSSKWYGPQEHPVGGVQCRH